MTRLDASRDGVVLRFEGATALLALARELRIPYDAIRAVRAGHEAIPSYAFRVGTSVPFTDVRYGRFWHGGTRHFYAVRDPARAVTLELDPSVAAAPPYRRVVVEVVDPAAVVAAIDAGRS